MKATELLRRRVIYAENRFAELVLWRLSEPLGGSKHSFKYRLAYIVNGECVLRFDNEAGKGDHRHWGHEESAYSFTGPDDLIAEFQNAIERWNSENRDP